VSKPIIRHTITWRHETNPYARAIAAHAATRKIATRTLEHYNVVEQPRPRSLLSKGFTWFLILLPVVSIGIYGIGYFYFAAQGNVGVNAYLLGNVQQVVGDISVPDHEGVFLQTGSNPKQPVKEILQYNDRSLQPPESSQVVLSPDDLRYILIRQGAVNNPGAYKVYSIQDGHADLAILVEAQHVDVPGIALIAIAGQGGKPWAPGHYMILVPDMDSGDYWCFFTVK
jgi:hypothetical protein